MNIRARLGVAAGTCVLWFSIFAPAISESIHRSTLEGPKPFSVQNVRDRLAEESDTGSPDDDEAIREILAKLSALELAEEERVMAMYGLLDPQLEAKAGELVSSLPPLTYAVDPRFFEPVVPSVVRRCIEIYGYALSPLPKASHMSRPSGMDRRDVLMRLLSAVHHQLLSPEQAAVMLQGATELLELQTNRMLLEAELRQLFEVDSAD